MSRLVLLIVAPILWAGFISASHAADQPIKYRATLAGFHEVPRNKSPGRGRAELTLVGNELSWTITFHRLFAPVISAHIHGPATKGVNAGVMINLGQSDGKVDLEQQAQPLESPLTGKATLTDTQIADLEAGKMYINIHTRALRGGEIRGQIVK